MPVLLVSNRGVTILAAVFIIVVLAFLGVVFLTLFTTSSSTSVAQLESLQALSIAEGGLEYIFANRTFPNYSMGGAAMNLGAGSFTVATPTFLTADPGAAGVVINVQSTANFPNAGRIVIDGELINYTGRTPGSFTGATRGAAGTSAVAHPAGNAVYPVTALTADPGIAGVTINVASTTGFQIPGIILLNHEQVYCTGATAVSFTNCTRGYKATPASPHAVGTNVFQFMVTSTGTVGSAQRAVARHVSRFTGGAMMVYSQTAAATTPFYRRWDGFSWGPQFAANAVAANIRYMVLKFSRTRNEAILGTLSANGNLRVQVWNGTGWGATTLLTTINAANRAYRGFDIEYETAGDRAVVVYNNNVNSQATYRIWNGAGWSAAANIALAAGIGVSRWVELAPNPLAASNEIAMIVLGSNTDTYGMRWTGAAWNNMGVAAAWDTTASISTRKAIDVAYEQLTGRALFIWGDSVATDQYYRIWDGGSLSPVNILLDIPAQGGVVQWVRLAPRAGANQIMYGAQDAGSDLNTRLWSGAAWDTAVQHPEHDAAVEDAADRNFDIVFETHPANSGVAWLVWGDGGTVSRRRWNGAAWGAAAGAGDDTALIQLMAHPASGTVFSAIYEDTQSATDDIRESHLMSGGMVWSPLFQIWAGATLANPVNERVFLAPERINPPLSLIDWQAVTP